MGKWEGEGGKHIKITLLLLLLLMLLLLEDVSCGCWVCGRERGHKSTEAVSVGVDVEG